MSTALTRWDPFAELRSQFDRMLDEVMVDGRERTWTPAIDVVREKDKLVIRADIPGVKPEDVKVEVEDDVLTVSGEHEERKEEKDKHYVRRERRYGAFQRSLVLPPDVDPEKIEAKTKDGVLEVTVPLPKEAKKKPITITPKKA